jgi:hypothetical protein
VTLRFSTGEEARVATPVTLGQAGPMRDMSGLLISRSQVVRDGGDASSLERDARRGLAVRLAAGVYVRADDWRSLDAASQHAARVHAVLPRLGPHAVVSLESALAVRGFPLLGEWPRRVHVIARQRARDKVSESVHHHSAPLVDGEIDMVDGLPVVGAARAAVDTVRRRDLRGATVVLDHGLREGACDRAGLEAALAARPGVPGSRRAAVAVAFADGRAESPGESLSRAGMQAAGLARPEVQVRFPWRGALIGFVDFWWPQFGVIGEFDGEVKYRDERMRAGRSPEQVVIDEKRREDDLRSVPGVRTVVRWTWGDALRVEPMVRALARAGVR